MSDVDERLAFSIPDAAAAVSVSDKTLRRVIAAGDLPVHYVGTRPLILRADLSAWLESLPTSR